MTDQQLTMLKGTKRAGLLTDDMIPQLIESGAITDLEAVELAEYQPSEEYIRLDKKIHEVQTDEEIDQLEASINLAKEFDLITEDEHDDLMYEFEGSFDLRLVMHEGVQMVQAAVPFWNGPETMRADGCIYTHGGCWLNIHTGEMSFDRD